MIGRTAAVAAMALLAAACSPASTAEPTVPNDAAATRSLPPIFPNLPRQRIVLMSSLPLVYGAGVDMADRIAGQARPHPLYSALVQDHDLVVADVLDARAFAGARIAVLVQPRALMPQELVALDGFVRGGGRMLLFADPRLEWPSGMGLGDPAGPLRSSLVSPLLAHWGLELTDPGIDRVRIANSGAVLVHPGQFGELPGKSGDASCRIVDSGYTARCTVGRGRAVLIADADLLDPDVLGVPGDSARANQQWVHDIVAELAGEDSS